MSSLPILQIHLLGRLQVTGSQGPIPVPQGQIPLLLAYLLLHPGRRPSREELAEVLWPAAAPGQARRRLSDLLYRVRGLLGEEWLVATPDTVHLRDADLLWVDVWQFQALANQDTPEAWNTALALYQGDLLPELDAEWILVQRVYLQDRYLDSLERVARHGEAIGDYPAALAAYRRMAVLDPLRETVCRGVMRCLARQGRIDEALQAYAAFADRLQAELAVSPQETTQELARRLRTERTLQQRPTRTTQLPFVGRLVERRRLLSALDRAYQGQGGVAVVLGEAGMGKSRLLGELAAAAAWRGWQVGWGHAEPLQPPPPYAPLPQALASLLSGPRLEQLAQLLQPHWRQILRPFLPLEDASAQAPDPEEAIPDPEQAIPVALTRLLQGLHRIAPHLLLLEDVHWADQGLWPLLDALRPALEEIGVLLVLSARPDELRQQELAWQRILSWDREGAPILYLHGMEKAALQELLLHAGWSPDSSLALDELVARGQGNPLLTLSLLETPPPEAAHRLTVQQVAQQRLDRLAPPVLERLAGAAVLGERFSYRDWQALCQAMGLTVDDLPQMVGVLEQARILLLQESGYRFAHETLQAAMYARIPAPQRQAWHQAALQILRGRADGSPQVLLRHALEAGDAQAVAYYALEAGERALAAAAFSTALTHAAQALAALTPAQTADRYRALALRVRTLAHLERWQELAPALDQLAQLAQQLGDPRRQAQVARHQAAYYQAQGQPDQARSCIEQGLRAARQAGSPELEAGLLLVKARLETQQGRYDQARLDAIQAQERYQTLHHTRGLAAVLNVLGAVAENQGDFNARLDYHRRAAALYRRSGDLAGETRTLAMLGGAYLNLGQFDPALEAHLRALDLCRELGDRAGEGRNLSNLGGIAMRLGRIAESLDYYRQALAISRSLGHRTRIGVDLNNLGSAYLSLHRFPEALACLDEALDIARETGFARLEGFAQYCRGQALLRMGEWALAQDALQAALDVREALGETFTAMIAAADLAYVAAARGDEPAAAQALDAALRHYQGLSVPPPPDVRMGLWLAAYQVRWLQGRVPEAMDFLLQALDAWDEQTAALSPEEQERFNQEMFYAQRLQEERERHTRRETAHLARKGTPSGRPRTPADHVAVVWTIQAPEDARFQDPARRRRHVLTRLQKEADAQGAAPTAADLARALHVSRRTVLRDLQVLRASCRAEDEKMHPTR